MAFWLIAAVFLGALGLVLAFANFGAKQPGNKPAGIDQINAPTAEEREIPVLFGTRDAKGPNVVWYGHMKTVAIKAKGGKK